MNSNPQQEKNIKLSLIGQQIQDDYQLISRCPQTCIKYKYTLTNKVIHTLVQGQSQDSIKNKAIVCSYADMDFKLSPVIHKQWLRLMSRPKLILGYMLVQPQVNKLLVQRIKKNFYSDIKSEWLMSFNSMLGIYYSVIKQLTKQNDIVLIFTPTYYRFLYTLNDQKRNVIQYQLKTRDSLNGKQLYIDFDQLRQIFEKNQIKLVIWANPHNPSGRIWKYIQLQKLANLVYKHKTFIFNDDIFSQCIIDPSQYTSLLKFQFIHPYLIWASSFGKAFNCSGNSYSYCFIPNLQIKNLLYHSFDHIPLFVDYSQFKLLQSCYTVGQKWRINTLKYVQQNYKILKEESLKNGLKLQFYTLDSSYLCLVDFSFYGWKYQHIKNTIESQNIFPTYFDTCYVNKQIQEIQIVRFNLGMNRNVIYQLAHRLATAINNSIQRQLYVRVKVNQIYL